MAGRRALAFGSGEQGSVLFEAALGIAAIFLVAIPFASLTSYGRQSARDLADVHAAVREAAFTQQLPAAADVVFGCGASSDQTTSQCALVLPRGSYISATRDTAIDLPFGLTLHTNARAVGRVG